jgi:hypothetical protein
MSAPTAVVFDLADAAGFRSIHSHCIAASKAPDKMLRMPRMGALGHGLAVVARTRASDPAAWTRLVSARFACDRRHPPRAGCAQPFFGER